MELLLREKHTPEPPLQGRGLEGGGVRWGFGEQDGSLVRAEGRGCYSVQRTSMVLQI